MGLINSKFIVISLSVLLLLYFVVFPLGVLLYDSILVDGSFTLANYREVYSQDVNWAFADCNGGKRYYYFSAGMAGWAYRPAV